MLNSNIPHTVLSLWEQIQALTTKKYWITVTYQLRNERVNLHNPIYETYCEIQSISNSSFRNACGHRYFEFISLILITLCLCSFADRFTSCHPVNTTEHRSHTARIRHSFISSAINVLNSLSPTEMFKGAVCRDYVPSNHKIALNVTRY